jgi:hypothetical protein
VVLVFNMVPLLMRLIPDTVFTQRLGGLDHAHQEHHSNGADVD